MGLVEEHFESLKTRDRFHEATLIAVPNGTYVVRIPRFPLPQGWNRSETTLYFVIPVGYPVAKPDTFWTEPGLALASGAQPQAANPGGNHLEGLPSGLLWFSWHAGTWNPNRDNLHSYVGLIGKRFQELR